MQAMGRFQKLNAAALVVVVASILLLSCEGEPRSARGGYTAERITADGCSEEDVVVYQSSAQHLASGIPGYSVQIINDCAGCTVSGVHIACGDFASTELVNPAAFRRLGFNDCLVKDGGAMGPGETISFEYYNSFAYPLDVASVSCD